MSEDVALAQIVTAITTVFYAAVFAIGYYLMIKGNRQVLREMHEERLSGGRKPSSRRACVLSDLRYLREGIPFLRPDERIRCLWDHMTTALYPLPSREGTPRRCSGEGELQGPPRRNIRN